MMGILDGCLININKVEYIKPVTRGSRDGMDIYTIKVQFEDNVLLIGSYSTKGYASDIIKEFYKGMVNENEI